MPTLIDDPDVIGVRLRDAAKAMNVSTRFLQLKIESGELNAIRLGPRALRIRPDDLRTYIEERLTENEINPKINRKPC
jgi:excisionase family DNA binding protein